MMKETLNNNNNNNGFTSSREKRIYAFENYLEKQINVNTEKEAVDLILYTLDTLLPNCLICVLSINSDNSIAYKSANGPLKENSCNKLEIAQSDIEKFEKLQGPDANYSLPEDIANMSQSYKPVFFGGVTGFDVPICDSEKLYGLVKIEYLGDGADSDMKLIMPYLSLACSTLKKIETKDELKLNNSYLKNILDRSNSPVVILNTNKRIIHVSYAFEKITQKDGEYFKDTDILEVVLPKHRDLLCKALDKTLERNEIFNCTFSISCESKKLKMNTDYSFAIKDIISLDGKIEALILIGNDISIVKELKKKIIHSEKLATLGQLAKGVADELGDPLTSVVTYSEYLSKQIASKADSSDMSMLDKIINASRRIDSFVKDLLLYARPTSDLPERINFNELAIRCVSFCEPVITEYDVKVDVEIQPLLPKVFGIEKQLEQVFVNLITNACHAMYSDTRNIKILAVLSDEGKVSVSVSNSGKIIPEDQLSDIFEPFVTTKPKGKGTGLGLSIVKNILLNHGTRIDVSSNPSSGTVFCFDLHCQAGR